MQQESSSARSSSLARDWYHLGRARTLDEVGRLIDGLTQPQHQRLSGRASAGGFHGGHARFARVGGARWSFLNTRLPNGLEIVAECNDAAYSTALGFFVKHGRPRRKRRGGRREPFPRTHGVQGHAQPLGRRREPRVRRDGRPLQRLHQRGEHGLLRRRAARAPGPGGRTAGRHPPAVAARGRFQHREAGDPRRDSDVRGPAAVRGRRQVPGAALRLASAGPQRAGHRQERRRADGRGDARLFPAPLQPGQHRAGRRRADRLRRAWWPRAQRRCGDWDAGGDRPTLSSRPPAARRLSGVAQGDGHAAVRRCSLPPARPPKTPTATPPNCWPPCWATTRAAGSTGNWSIPAWPNTSASATASTRAPAC